MFSKGDRIKFTAMKDPLNGDETTIEVTGTVTRAWSKPASDPYVTVKTDDGRTFTRCTSRVQGA